MPECEYTVDTRHRQLTAWELPSGPQRQLWAGAADIAEGWRKRNASDYIGDILTRL